MPKLLPMNRAVEQHLADLHRSAERAATFRARSLMRSRPVDGSGVLKHRVIVVNDLHIGAGRDPETGRFYAGDDFTNVQTRQFVAYLLNEWRAAAHGDPTMIHPTRSRVEKVLDQLTWKDGSKIDVQAVTSSQSLERRDKYKLTLCINGDFVDFLQTAATRSHFPYPDGFSPSDSSPRNTPANAIVQLNIIRSGHPEVFRALAVHLRMGHELEIIPGNHDRHFWNDHVWQGEVAVQGKRFGGFTRILAEELRALGAGEAEVKECLARTVRRPFGVYGDKWIDHGDMGDRNNRVQRPYKEIFDTTPLHEEMSMAVGDYGVRGGFNAIEVLDPTLDAIQNTAKIVKQSMRHPAATAKLLLAFVKGLTKEGYEESQAADEAQRVADMKALVDKFPYITEQLNALRPEDDKLSRADVVDGLAAIEKASATPLFSNFEKGTGLFKRLARLVAHAVTGKLDSRSNDEVNRDRLVRMNERLGINDVVHGHTHAAQDQHYISERERLVREVNTHTWMTQKGDWGRPTVTWGEDGRGVGVIELGVDDSGKPWSKLSLMKVIDEVGSLVEGDIIEDADIADQKLIRNMRAEASRIYEANRAQSDQFSPSTAISTIREAA